MRARADDDGAGTGAADGLDVVALDADEVAGLDALIDLAGLRDSTLNTDIASG